MTARVRSPDNNYISASIVKYSVLTVVEDFVLHWIVELIVPYHNLYILYILDCSSIPNIYAPVPCPTTTFVQHWIVQPPTYRTVTYILRTTLPTSSPAILTHHYMYPVLHWIVQPIPYRTLS